MSCVQTVIPNTKLVRNIEDEEDFNRFHENLPFFLSLQEECPTEKDVAAECLFLIQSY